MAMGADNRAFIRVKAAKRIELTMGAGTYNGQTHDIGQGGLCFTVNDSIDLGVAIVRIANSDYFFPGKILASHKSSISRTPLFHFQFDKPVDKATLAVIMGI